MENIRKIFISHVILGILIFLCRTNIVESVYATDYYVSPTGIDTNSGTLTQPFAKIQTGINHLYPGDTLYIRTGIYSEKINFVRSGIAGSPITVTSYPNETATIDGTNITVNSNDGLVKIAGLAYITLNHLTIQNSGYIGVYANAFYSPFVATHNITFSNLTVLNSHDAAIKIAGGSFVTVDHSSTRESVSSGIGIWNSDHVLVDHNKIVNAHNISEADGGHEECISIANTFDFEVSYNEVSFEGMDGFLGAAGIDVKESSYTGTVHHNYIHDFVNDGAIYLDAWTAGLNGTLTLHNVKVFNNKVYQAGGITVGSEQGGTAENIDVYNNLIIRSSFTGIDLSNTGSTRGGNGLRKNINIFNNTIYQSIGNGGAGIYIVTTNIENIIIKNNLVAFDPKWVGQITIADPSVINQVTTDHNLTFGRTLCSIDYPNCKELNTGTIRADPQFMDSSNFDLRLKSTSPAIDNALNMGLTTDFNDIARPQGPQPDIGAFEYVPVISPTPTSTPPPPTGKPGDANGDGKVDGQDYVVWLNHYGTTASGAAKGDFNNDGMVDGRDYVVWLNNYGK
jgi:hypothetical protein